MYIRRLLDDDYEKVVKLIYDTVHTVCKNEYTPIELDAWAPKNFNVNKFRSALSGCYNLCAFSGDTLVGFISMERNGYINRLYTHKNFQNRGIASALLRKAELWAEKNGIYNLSLDSSKTAEEFYLKKGFKKEGISVIKHGDIVFRNTVMKKTLTRKEDV